MSPRNSKSSCVQIINYNNCIKFYRNERERARVFTECLRTCIMKHYGCVSQTFSMQQMNGDCGVTLFLHWLFSEHAHSQSIWSNASFTSVRVDIPFWMSKFASPTEHYTICTFAYTDTQMYKC